MTGEPSAPTARVATARGSENSGHFCKYPNAWHKQKTMEVFRTEFEYKMDSFNGKGTY